MRRLRMFYPILVVVVLFGTDHADARCPNARPVSCSGPANLRTIDGSCNNRKDPTIGMANTPLIRILPARYADGVHEPRRSATGEELVSARRLVTGLLPDRNAPSLATNGLVMTWTQLVTHDVVRIQAPFPRPNGRCCAFGNATDACHRIPVPSADPLYGPFGVLCIGVDRTASAPCHTEAHEQNSVVTHFLDASFVYGSSAAVSQRLREHRGGRLRTQIIMADEFLPMNSDGGMDAGDARVTITPMMAALQTLFLREHNRVARILSGLNARWTDEQLFQETRRIVVAQWQLLSYRDWLQWVIGTDAVQRNSLLPSTRTYSKDYNESVDPSVANDFTTGAFRSFHSMVPNDIWFTAGAGERLERRLLNSVGPDVVLSPANLRRVVMGMILQPRQLQDQFMATEIAGRLFRGSNQFGGDLVATDIERGREHGLPGYNEYRAHCGLRRASDFDGFNDTISASNIELLRAAYSHPDDVDLMVGGLLEQIDSSDPLASVTSPSFRCLVLDQFRRLKSGDRFFFDLAGPQAFTPNQLAALGKQTFSRLVCDNIPRLNMIPSDAFLRVGVLGNTLVPCSTLHKVDYSHWRASTAG